MNKFILYLSFGKLEISEDSGVVRGEAHVYTQEGNRHTIWTPQTMEEVATACDAIRSLGEEPFGLAMNPREHEALQNRLLNGPLAVVSVRKVCECGSAKAGLPTHSTWCPIK